MKPSLANKSDSSGSSSLEDEDETSTASTAINTTVPRSANHQQHREKHLVSRMDHHRIGDLIVDDDDVDDDNDDEDDHMNNSKGNQQHQLQQQQQQSRDELYDNLHSSILAASHSDENVNDLDFQLSANSRPFALLNVQDTRFLGIYIYLFSRTK